MKILNVIGTRPEAIKMAILHKLLLEHEKFEPILCLTGQHTHLATEALDVFDVTPDYCCFVNHQLGSLSHAMSELLSSLQDIIGIVNPDLIIVQGDTLTSYCGAMVGFLNKIKVAHIEAGLRTNNKFSPFPEEIFRQFNDKLADYHFAPTSLAVDNLIKENIALEHIYKTGNTGIDALLFMKHQLNDSAKNVSGYLLELVSKIKRKKFKLLLLTLHRREGYESIIPLVLNEINLLDGGEYQVVFPVHTNPNLNRIVNEAKLKDSIHCIDALSYRDFIWLMIQSDLILTDSGGVQEEAPYLGKSVIVLRNDTERQELLSITGNKLFDQSHLRKDIKEKVAMVSGSTNQLFGDGTASQKIVKILEQLFL